MKLEKVYEDVKKNVKRRILDDVLFLLPLTFLAICMAITSCENVIAGEAVSAVMSGIMAFVSLLIWGSVLNKMIKFVVDEIWHFKCVAEVSETYKDVDIKNLKAQRKYLEEEVSKLLKKLGYKKCMTLDEILEEQENGDTKECECELEQGD